MSSSNGSAVEESVYRQSGKRRRGGCGGRGQWSGFNIAAMVVGFVLFWPVGLVVLGWILSGRHVRDLPAAVRRQWENLDLSWPGAGRRGEFKQSGNSVFEAYQQTQYERIAEIKQEIGERSRRFSEFRADARRRADEEEFRQFMASSPVSDSN